MEILAKKAIYLPQITLINVEKTSAKISEICGGKTYRNEKR